MKNILKILSIIFLTFVLTSCGGDAKTEEQSSSDNMQMNGHEHQMKDAEGMEHEMVRKGVIDVESLDANEDGKLYECPMDWNVLSDHDGDCPTCGMNLKEYSIADVKANLDKYGYEYKK